MVLLIALAALYGAAAVILFRWTTNAEQVRATTNLILAHIMEFRLFLDEPALIWNAQKAALRANLTLLKLIALPCLIMLLPVALAWPAMANRFGHGPLPTGSSTVMTSHSDSFPTLRGIVVETPGVRIPRTGEVVWRVRRSATPLGAVPTGVKIRYPDSHAWIVWFAVISSLSAIAVAKTI